MNKNQKQDPAMQRNMYIAIALSGVILLCWELFYNAPIREQRLIAQHEAEMQVAQQTLQQVRVKSPDFVLGENEEFVIKTEDLTYDAINAPSREEIISKSPRVTINNDKVHGSVRLQGARIDDITLADYRQSIEEDSPEVELMSPTGAKTSNFVEVNWISHASDIQVPTSKTTWSVVSGEQLTPTTPLMLRWDNPQGFTFYKKISIDNNYMFIVEQSIQNNSAEPAIFSPYGLISKTQVFEETAPLGIMHVGPMGVFEGILEETSYDDLRDDGVVKFDGNTDWIGISDKYWLKSLVPQGGETYKVNFRYNNNKGQEKFQVDYLGNGKSVEPGAIVKYETKLFAGAKELTILDEYESAYNIKLFDRAIDFGWFYFMTKPLSQVLVFFYGLIGNFGLAIILLTFCVKLALFPLARKGYKSMGRLRQLSPQIQELRERHKDDKMKMNQAMMELYKTEKVNPAGGCLPILLQIPVFFALYKVLFVSLEMRHAPFFGWIQDLSAPDPTSFWNGFGLLPFESPDFLAIGIWPIIMAITMYLQQTLSPAPPDPTQAKMMKALPVLFLFLFHSFPAGLIIYWSVSNSLTFLQQLYFTVRLPRK